MDPVNEGTTPTYQATVRDAAGLAVPGASLLTLTLTYYDRASGTIINARNAQNVLNANGVTVDANGLLVWALTVLDTPILATRNELEEHVALFTWTWDVGGVTKTGRHEAEILVRNLEKLDTTPA